MNLTAIHQFASSHSGSILLAGESENTVHVWDLSTLKKVHSFKSIFDAGSRGSRFTISHDGTQCVAGAYGGTQGIAAYCPANGSLIWQRKELKRVQWLRIAQDGRRVYCGFDEKPMHILDLKTGQNLEKLPGIKRLWESPYEELLLVDTQYLAEERDLTLQTSSREEIVARIPRAKPAVLDVAFSPGAVCISEVGGPIRCVDTHSGKERWRHTIPGQHSLSVTYSDSSHDFLAINFPYQDGGSFLLTRFNSTSGEPTAVVDLECKHAAEFCQNGSRVITSDGPILDSQTGKRVATLDFPKNDAPAAAT